MKERDCENCKHHTEDGCSSWDCEFEKKDLISRADAIAYIDRVIKSGLGRYKSLNYIRKYISALPSAEAVSREEYEDIIKDYRKQYENMNNEIADLESKLSADAVPQLKQTDTLIIADALRYLAKDTERHLVDRTRADALRQQFLKYGASMCKGGDTE